jgi:sugar phosphate isomerase/epimerase
MIRTFDEEIHIMHSSQIGVCSWSLALPNLKHTLDVIRDTLKLRCVHLGFMGSEDQAPSDAVQIVQSSGLHVAATAVGFAGEDYSSIQRIAETGGYVVDSEWDRRRDKTLAVARFSRAVGVPYLSVHVGFLPQDQHSRFYERLVGRVRMLCDKLEEWELTLLMETGQERAEQLLAFVDAVDRNNIKVNFDPANMILYGVGDPGEAATQLKDHIAHVHMKDGAWSDNPGTVWGRDVVLGTGDVGIPQLVSKLKAQGYTGPLSIEREAGEQRVADVRAAITLLELVGCHR